MEDNKHNGISYDSLNLLYRFDDETPSELCRYLAINLKKRRLERGLSREALSAMSGVAASTIAKFERQHTISLSSFVAIVQALDYKEELKEIFRIPKYKTLDQLSTIKKNKNRKRGRNDFTK